MTKEVHKKRLESCGDPRSVINRAEQSLAAQAPDKVWQFSPIFPGTWPPAGELVAILYAYERFPLPTNTERWQVESPFLRLDVPLATTEPPRLTRLDARALGFENKPLMQATPEAMEQAAAPLLDAVCAGVLPAPADAARLRAAYRAWIFDHGALAAELQHAVPAFFKWVAEGD